MNKNEKLVLIEGKFSYEEVKDILINIFSTKIQFHEMKDFSSMERFGRADEIAQIRISALKKELTKLQDILAEAKAKQKKLIVSSDINITLADD